MSRAGGARCLFSLATRSIYFKPPPSARIFLPQHGRLLDSIGILPKVCMTLAYIGVLQDWDWEAAERDFLKAIELVLKCFDCAVGCSPAPMQAERLFVAVSAPSASDERGDSRSPHRCRMASYAVSSSGR